MTDICQRCEDSAPTTFCLQCSVLLCQECSSCLHSLGVFTKHSLNRIETDSSQGGDLCKSHGALLTHFCTEDWQPLCQTCLILHSSHPVIIFAEAVAETKHEINTKAQRLTHSKRQLTQDCERLDSTLQELNSNSLSAKNALKQSFEAIRQMLEWKEEELASTIEHARYRKQTLLDCLKTKAETQVTRIEGVLDLLDVASKLNGQALLGSLNLLSSKIDQVANENLQLDNAVEPDAPVLASLDEIKALIELLHVSDRETSKEAATPAKRGPQPLPETPQSADKLTKSASTFSRRSAPKLTKTDSKTLAKSDSTLRHSATIDITTPSPRNLYRLSAKAEGSKVCITPRTPARTKTLNLNYSQVGLFQSPRKSEVNEDPYSIRQFIKNQATSTAIQVSWTHPQSPPADLVYALEYGVGIKVGGIEQFRQVYKGTAYTCIITDLLPKTTYRFRIASVNKTSSEYGDWSEVMAITTNEAQSIDPSTCGVHASVINRATEKWIQFDRPGTVFASCPLAFSKHCWDVKLVTTALFTTDDATSAMKLGVSTGKNKQVVGCLLPYSGCKGPVKAKMVLDLESRTLTCFTQANPHGEVFSSLPEGPLVPAFMNKPAKSAASVKMLVKFDKPVEYSL